MPMLPLGGLKLARPGKKKLVKQAKIGEEVDVSFLFLAQLSNFFRRRTSPSSS